MLLGQHFQLWAIAEIYSFLKLNALLATKLHHILSEILPAVLCFRSLPCHLLLANSPQIFLLMLLHDPVSSLSCGWMIIQLIWQGHELTVASASSCLSFFKRLGCLGQVHLVLLTERQERLRAAPSMISKTVSGLRVGLVTVFNLLYYLDSDRTHTLALARDWGSVRRDILLPGRRRWTNLLQVLLVYLRQRYCGLGLARLLRRDRWLICQHFVLLFTPFNRAFFLSGCQPCGVDTSARRPVVYDDFVLTLGFQVDFLLNQLVQNLLFESRRHWVEP